MGMGALVAGGERWECGVSESLVERSGSSRDFFRPPCEGLRRCWMGGRGWGWGCAETGSGGAGEVPRERERRAEGSRPCVDGFGWEGAWPIAGYIARGRWWSS